MNVKTNFYGAIGLASTIGKNGFALGKNTSYYTAGACQWIHPTIDLKIRGYGVLEKLGEGAEKIHEFDKEREKDCKAWEEWADKKYVEAKAQENLYEYLRKLNNQPTDFERVCKFAKKVGGKIDELSHAFVNSATKQWGKTKSFINSMVKKWRPSAPVKDLVNLRR